MTHTVFSIGIPSVFRGATEELVPYFIRRCDRGLHSLDRLDAATIQCLYTSEGTVPREPSPAYRQQVAGGTWMELLASDIVWMRET